MMRTSSVCLFAVIISSLLILPVHCRVCSGTNRPEMTPGQRATYDCGSFAGPVKLVWKVTGNSCIWCVGPDEYKAKLFLDDNEIYSSAEFSDETEKGFTNIIGGDGGNYKVVLECANEFYGCEEGTFHYELLECDCLSVNATVLSPCSGNDIDGVVQDATCGNNCEPGYYSTPEVGCTQCDNFKIISTADVQITDLNSPEECGVLGTTGFWSLAKTGAISVNADNNVVSWSLTKSASTSSGVERTSEFAEAWGEVRGTTTSMETSVSVGFAATASAGLWGTGVSVESSVDFTTTVGTEKSFEVSTESTNTVGRAVSEAIANEDSITCTQECGANTEFPDALTGYIYNWVEAVYDDYNDEFLHYVRTCATWCKYDNIPPICPPGKCYNVECNVCEPGAFNSPELDALASYIPSTGVPTLAPSPRPRNPRPPSDDGGGFCFSGNMEVVVQGKGAVLMEALQVGDFVKTGNGEAYEQIYAFGHRATETYAEFVQLHTNIGFPLEMTGEHLLFVDGKTNPVRADSIKVGDLLQAENSSAVVERIELVTRSGIYNPLTSSGTIQVNGITASNYISFQTENNDYVEFQGGVEIIPHHDAAHVAMTPYRFYCTTLAVCDVSDTNSGMPVYVSMGIELIEWSKKQHILVQLFVYASFRMLLLASILMACAVLMIPAYLLSGCSIFQIQRFISHISTIGVSLNKGIEMKKEN